MLQLPQLMLLTSTIGLCLSTFVLAISQCSGTKKKKAVTVQPLPCGAFQAADPKGAASPAAPETSPEAAAAAETAPAVKSAGEGRPPPAGWNPKGLTSTPLEENQEGAVTTEIEPRFGGQKPKPPDSGWTEQETQANTPGHSSSQQQENSTQLEIITKDKDRDNSQRDKSQTSPRQGVTK